MQHDTPLRVRHEAYGRAAGPRGTDPETAAHRPGAAVGHRVEDCRVEYITYGPPDEAGMITCEIPSTFGAVEAEYAAIHRWAGLLDQPHRGTIRVTGAERRDFLNRMLTQRIEDLAPGRSRAAFWLNRQGRIQADILAIELGDEMLLDVDVHVAAETVRTLDEFLFAEDVQLVDVSAEVHRVAVLGPMASEVVAVAADSPPDGAAPPPLEPLATRRTTVAGVDVVVVRRDETGAVGLELIVPRADAATVWDALCATDARLTEGRRRIRPVGWFAYNTARIEAGVPLFNIDFGVTNLPHETGVLAQRVSFRKGCYLGQEIVARIESRGRPKQTLVGLRMNADLLPVAGGQVFERTDEGMGEPLGVVTSSTVSPMLGARPVAFAMLRTEHAAEGTVVLVNAEGAQGEAEVTPLVFV